MGNEVVVSDPLLFYDDCSVIADESTEKQETSIKIGIEKELASQEDVHEGDQHHDGQA